MVSHLNFSHGESFVRKLVKAKNVDDDESMFVAAAAAAAKMIEGESELVVVSLWHDLFDCQPSFDFLPGGATIYENSMEATAAIEESRLQTTNFALTN